MGSGGLWWPNVLNSALSPQRLRPDTRPEHQDPVSHTAQKKREEKKKEKIMINKKIFLIIKIKKFNKIIKIKKNLKSNNNKNKRRE